ncbi:lysozyme inhibitor LprI family protein [Neogemmobacter tilapiae]|uniref:Lysozyme inhibitor LprI-like N-terminal domain-containing protein n=1 Tax=Neogemmobacter tilapiae TaxID=875041 RepID=A0A918TSJ6_9RHOB|nr:lysozyme inhibitor LprI family protein [Gemmobacter tilapiae]GHC57897.1 hypothetical protein GCM10007315_21780 [Gemmobacter tilapiae]
MRLAVILAGLLLAAPTWAQDIDCDNAMTQSDMNQCASMDYDAADVELNAVWKDAMATMKEIDSYLDDSEKGAEDALRESQRSWINYRDKTCEADGYRMKGGSAEPMLVAGCLASVTRNRTEELRGLVEGY